MVDLGGDVRALIAQAQRIAQRNNASPSTGHLLLAMLESRDDTSKLLESCGARSVAFYEVLRGGEAEAANLLDLTLARAQRIAMQSGSGQVRSLHLLLAMLQNARSEATRKLFALGVQVENLRRVLEDSLGMPSQAHMAQTAGQVRAEAARPEAARPLPRTLIDWEAQKRAACSERPLAAQSSAAPPVQRPPPRNVRKERTEKLERLEPAEARAAEPPRIALAPKPAALPAGDDVSAFALDAGKFPLLANLGRNLSLEAFQGRIDPVLGREREIEQVLDVLARRRANNPLLVGPPGVGKTAIAEGLALRLLQETAQGMRGRVLIEVSAGALVSGTSVRGALAEKIARLRGEVKAGEGRVLLFLDEIHALVGASDGPDDLANELKAALARGELPCMGATTELEYRRVFERDAALSRRFTRIEVGEPTRDAALSILSGIAAHYERFHGVAYARDALEAAVDLGMRYLPEQHLPDKAIGLIDRAAARSRRRGVTVVDRAAVAAVVSEQAGVPIERLLMRDKERLLSLESLLGERVIGQRAVLGKVAEAIRKGAVGLRGKRPLSVFLFLGPTGVGKTELAKALSDELFASGGMTRLDMSEYSESHAVARLIGAPPGYVGHEDGGQLTEAVRKKPYQLLLLDEVEKAHSDVLLALLPLLDEGRLTDGRGRTVDFTNTVIVLTSNLGVRNTAGERSIGFGAERAALELDEWASARALAAVRAALPPELYNRLDEVLYFPKLTRADVGRIAERMLLSVGDALRREQRIEASFDSSVVDALIAAGGYDPELGARPMRRTVAREVESLLAGLVLRGELQPGDSVALVGDGNKVRVERLRRLIGRDRASP
jgi:ATP-dependent Clp protease ATP-binding subunit ClpC